MKEIISIIDAMRARHKQIEAELAGVRTEWTEAEAYEKYKKMLDIRLPELELEVHRYEQFILTHMTRIR